MDLTNARATFGLNAKATPVKSGSSGTIQIGDSNSSISLTDATKIISFDAVLVGSASNLVIDVSDLDNTGSTSWTAGTAQVETNTIVAAAGCTSNGNMTLVVTSAGMTGSPKNVVVALTTATHTTAAIIATAARTALASDTAVGGRFTIAGTGADITLTRKPTSTYTVNGTSVPVYPANDATANLAIPSGLGVTADATSTDTTTGVATAGTYCPDLDGTDFEGEATGGMTSIHGLFIDNSSDSQSAVVLTNTGGEISGLPLQIGHVFQIAGGTDSIEGDFDISSTAVGDESAVVTVTISGL